MMLFVLVGAVLCQGWPVILACALLLGLYMFYADCDVTLFLLSKFGTISFDGKTVWVTGASSGIGEYCAYAFARRGARVILSARRKDVLERVRARCANASCHVIAPLDLMDHASHSGVVASVLDKVGRVDYLVNNAGQSQRGLAVSTRLEVDKRQLDLNVLGTISLTKALLPHLLEAGGGTRGIVVVSSLAGRLGSPAAAAYSCAKHALNGFYDALRLETISQGVEVTLVCPGPVVSQGGDNAMTDAVDPARAGLAPPSAYNSRRMPTSRCADLVCVATKRGLSEVWISPQPELVYTYLRQYSPVVYNMIARFAGVARVNNFRRELEVLNKQS